MEISEDLNSKSIKFDKNNVLDYISNIYSAFELIIDRDADYENIDALSMASDNVWCAGVILGNPIENWKNVDFNTLKSTLYWKLRIHNQVPDSF
jgi:2-keto-4-pentenoate hydratase